MLDARQEGNAGALLAPKEVASPWLLLRVLLVPAQQLRRGSMVRLLPAAAALAPAVQVLSVTQDEQASGANAVALHTGAASLTRRVASRMTGGCVKRAARDNAPVFECSVVSAGETVSDWGAALRIAVAGEPPESGCVEGDEGPAG